MMKAVIEHTRIVSKYTPSACTKPGLAGRKAEGAVRVSWNPEEELPESGVDSRMMKAVIEHTRIVSKYTPSACTKPCLAGCEAEAVAAAFGTEPMPASLENRPRWTPMSMIEPSA